MLEVEVESTDNVVFPLQVAEKDPNKMLAALSPDHLWSTPLSTVSSGTDPKRQLKWHTC